MKCKDCILKPFFNCTECKSQSSYKAKVIMYNKKYKDIKLEIDKISEKNNLNKEEKEKMLDKVKSIIFEK